MPVGKDELDGLRIDKSATRERKVHRALFAAVIGGAILIVGGLLVALRPSLPSVHVAEVKSIQGDSKAAVLNATGYVTARRQATVSSKTTGKVVEVNIEEGMHVAPGQVLARLDDSIPQAALRLAKAEETAQRSALEETKVRIEEARIDMKRAQSLEEQQISARADLDHARAALNALEARLNAQQDSLNAATRQVELTQHDVDDCVIRAPFAGIAVSKNAQPGEMISPISAGGGFTRTGIGTIVDMDSLEIEVDVNEAYIHRVKAGQAVESILDAYPEWKIPSHVITVIPTADRQKATVKVRIGFDTKDPRILPDMGVKVSFIENVSAAERKSIIDVPKAALRRDGEQDVVLVVNAEERVERRAVAVSGTEGESARILSGLTNGERVVVDGPAELKDGDHVRVARETDR